MSCRQRPGNGETKKWKCSSSNQMSLASCGTVRETTSAQREPISKEKHAKIGIPLPLRWIMDAPAGIGKWKGPYNCNFVVRTSHSWQFLFSFVGEPHERAQTRRWYAVFCIYPFRSYFVPARQHPVLSKPTCSTTIWPTATRVLPNLGTQYLT